MRISPIESICPNWFEPILKPAAALSAGVIGWLFYKKIKGASQQPPKAKEPEWLISDDFGQKTGIDMEMITESLTQSHIPFTIVPASQWPPKNRISIPLNPEAPVDLLSKPGEVIWKNAQVEVVLVNEKGRYHLLVKPGKDVTLAQISDDDYVALKQIIKSIPDLFEKVFGFPDYCEGLMESKSTFGFELFPALTKDAKEVDLLDKDMRNLYLLSRGRWQTYSLPHDRIEILKQTLPNILSKTPNRAERPFQAKREEVNLANAQKFRVTTLLKLLAHEGYPVLSVEALTQRPRVAAFQKDARTHETKKCFFCKVPPKELVSQGTQTQVIINPLSYVIDQDNSRHVLVAPNQHIEDCISLTKEQVIAELKTFRSLRQAWEKLYPDEEFFAWKQQGIKAGQTVPHLHAQVLTAKLRDIFQYYIYMVKEVKKPPSFLFPPNLKLSQELKKLA